MIDWVDLFTRPVYKEVIIDSLNFCIKNKSLVVYAYCIMPSHIHLIAASTREPLDEIIRDLKKFTSKALVKMIQETPESRREWLLNKFSFAAKRLKGGVNYKLWQDGFHPLELASNKMIDQRFDYVHNNPVVEAYVYSPEQWVYGSAAFYISNEENRAALHLSAVGMKCWNKIGTLYKSAPVREAKT